jgi:GT2 family glycosyltransferase
MHPDEKQYMKKNITAIVVTWNSRKLVPGLAGTIVDIEPMCDIVVSDNASGDTTVETIRELIPKARIISNSMNGGFGYGNNRGIEISETEYVLLLNSDASITRSSLEILVDTLKKNPDAAGVQPLLRLWDWPLVTMSAGAAMTEYGRGYDFDFMHFQPFPDNETVEVPCVTAALSLFRTEAIRRAGGFDENIFMYFEDIDLSLRLRGLGYRLLLESAARAQHMMGASSSRMQAENWELQSSEYLTRKFLGGMNCKLPNYWRKEELRTKISCMLKGRPWLWRLAALRKARKIDIEHINLSKDFLMKLLAPRPLRMPHPRSNSAPGEFFPASHVSAGPGWQGNKTDVCGFGCLKVPNRSGVLTLSLKSCNIPGSAALWSNKGCLERVFLNGFKKREMKTEIAEGTMELYLVPDRKKQIIELENVTYTDM